MSAVSPRSVNHVAYATGNSAVTTDFYTRVMGMRLVTAVREDRVPSTGDETPFLHTFFGMADGTCIAFFEVDGLDVSGESPLPRWIQHIALNVSSMQELEGWKTRLAGHNIDVLGIVDHEGIWQSIYFFDPNGIRLELTYQARELTEADTEHGRVEYDRWVSERGHVVPAAG
jgi:catechol 2,3-dioxygenase-like lactoylglutathione lyase family enzyme